MAPEITQGAQALYQTFIDFAELPDRRQFDPQFMDHDPADGQPAGGAGLAWFWSEFGESFSDIGRHIVETIVTPEHVVTIIDLSGRHTGQFMGHAPTGRSFSVRNVQVARFRDSRMVERWGSTDEIGILRQLGLG